MNRFIGVGKMRGKIEKSPVLHTPWGTAKLQKSGYYIITTGKEGNYGKRLHRLIFEKYYGPIPEGFVIHHKDGNKWNNCLFNLQLMRHNDHAGLSTKGKNHSSETIAKMRKLKSGEKHPRSRYHNLWDNSKVQIQKNRLFKKGGAIGKAFKLKYNGKKVNCGYFIDPVSCEIIHDFIEEAIANE